jgi:hypothetical protein
MDGWLEEARAKLAEAVGEDPAGYDLTEAEATELLDLARIAAHDSGERTSAPLLCYLVGLAHGRHGGDLSDLVDATVGPS